MDIPELIVCLIASAFGFFLIIMSWASLIYSHVKKKHVSPAPFGGLIVAVIFLISHNYKLLALLGLLDPTIWLFIAAVPLLIKELKPFVFPEEVNGMKILYHSEKGNYGQILLDTDNEKVKRLEYILYYAVVMSDDGKYHCFGCNCNSEMVTDKVFDTFEECKQEVSEK